MEEAKILRDRITPSITADSKGPRNGEWKSFGRKQMFVPLILSKKNTEW